MINCVSLLLICVMMLEKNAKAFFEIICLSLEAIYSWFSIVIDIHSYTNIYL